MMKAYARSVALSTLSAMAEVWPSRRRLADEEASGPPDRDSLCEVGLYITFVHYMLLGLLDTCFSDLGWVLLLLFFDLGFFKMHRNSLSPWREH